MTLLFLFVSIPVVFSLGWFTGAMFRAAVADELAAEFGEEEVEP